MGRLSWIVQLGPVKSHRPTELENTPGCVQKNTCDTRSRGRQMLQSWFERERKVVSKSWKREGSSFPQIFWKEGSPADTLILAQWDCPTSGLQNHKVTSAGCFKALCLWWGFPGASVVKGTPASAGDIRDTGLILGSGGSSGGGHGNPLQYSCLENPTDRGTWQATVHRIAERQTRLRD